MSPPRYDVAVVGAGMVGATLACLLSRGGFSVALIEAAEPRAFDKSGDVGLRVSAISPGSGAVLEQAGAWRLVEAQRHRAYRRMRVEDGAQGEPLLFDAPAFNLERLGTIVENDLVQWSLWQVLTSAALVDLYCPDRLQSLECPAHGARIVLHSGKALSAALVVGADGAASSVRRQVGIGQEHLAYNQHALVAVIGKQQANPGVAWQRFMPGGPLAFLPLANGRSSIVWTRPTAEARRLVALDAAAFTAELQRASTGWLGQVTQCGPRAAFPLAMRLSERYVSHRVALLGDAAHAVHPLAGQGVNLGLADVAGLAEHLIGARHEGADIGGSRVLEAYDRWRRSESETMAFGMHAIRSLFGIDELEPLRRVGLAVVRRSWALQDLFIRRAIGMAGNAPRLARGETLNDLLRN
jgi:2-octaprenyl-3-methyl-6-methoxy-1,4-benzoquinol hydroxylase/2-octaprenylphenol hydroxylase